MSLHTCLLTAACAVGLLGTAAAAPNRLKPATNDAGPTASSTLITTSIFFNVTDLRGLQRFVAETVTPGSRNFHRFLTVGQFRHRFAPSNHQIRQFVHFLESFGITVDKIYADNLDITVTGTAAQLNAALSTQLHDITRNGQRFHRPAWRYVLPSEFASMVLAVPGLSNEPGDFRPHNEHVGAGAFAKMTPRAVNWPRSGTATGEPENFTVGDFANFYDVNPLYRAGIEGRGQTVGIMTLANFNVADVEAYWNDIGLRVRPNRITKVMVDGGTPVRPKVGDDETSLDVEQSGGIAPDAKVVVYVAPNNNNAFMDMFYAAVSDNKADTLSTSWGKPEELYFAALAGEDLTGQMIAMDQAFLEGAAQGQSMFTATGDSGAFDINGPAPAPLFSKQLSVDYPASDPYITAAGGTTAGVTVPGIPRAGCPDLTIATEQVWGWDYLASAWQSCLPNLGLTFFDIFPGGAGGGVSSFWPIPFYQQFTAGMQQTQPGQSLIFFPNFPDTSGAQDLIDLPAGFAGRNLPDLSVNSDPQTGYVVVDCTDFPAPKNPGCAQAGFGGTSFAAPQLNGTTALIDQAAGGRVGFLNPVLYGLQHLGYGKARPFNDIASGDNWFYFGMPGYDDGAGIGTPNAANLAIAYTILSELH